MTIEAPEKKKDRFAAARAARAKQLAAARANQDSVAALTKLVADLASKVDSLSNQKAPPLNRQPGPERKLTDFIKGMHPGEQRDGIREVRDSDIVAMEGAMRSGDIVKILPDTQKGLAWRKALGNDDPIYGTVLQYLGRTQNKRGPRKYKVHFKGIGRDGVTDEEIALVQAAS